VFLSSAADLYIASLGAEAPADVEEVQGEMTVESEDSELDAIADEAEEVTEEELEADEEEGGLEELTVEELKEELRDAGLPVSGTKAELIERLEDATEADDE
jgi:hypothetical protein